MTTAVTEATGRSRSVVGVRDLRRGWRFALAVIAPLPWLALGVEVLDVPFRVSGSFATEVAGAAAHPLRMTVSLLLTLVFVFTGVPAVAAIAWITRRTSPRLALVGGLLTIGAFGATWDGPDTDPVVAVTARAGLRPAGTSALLTSAGSHPAALGALGLGLFLLGQIVGFAALAVALWRSGRVPRWVPIVLPLSAVLHLFAPDSRGNILASGAWLLTAVCAVPVSRALVRMPDNEFDLPPVDGRVTGIDGDLPSATRDARRTWRVLLAVTAPIGALGLAVVGFSRPLVEISADIGAFRDGLSHPGAVGLGVVLDTLTALGVAGVVAAGWLARRASPVLATVGTALSVLGLVALNDARGTVEALTAAATRSGADRPLAARLVTGIETLPQHDVLAIVAVAGLLTGSLVLAAALLRSRSVPTAFAAVLAASQPVATGGVLTHQRLLVGAGWLLAAVAFAACGRALLHLSDESFDLPPTGR